MVSKREGGCAGEPGGSLKARRVGDQVSGAPSAGAEVARRRAEVATLRDPDTPDVARVGPTDVHLLLPLHLCREKYVISSKSTITFGGAALLTKRRRPEESFV